MNKKPNNPAMKKGMVSLNPAGRPKGTVNKYTALARELMSDKSPEIVEKVISKALEGDVHCLKMCLDRILPVHKAVDPHRTKSDSQVIINVSSIESIQKQIGNTPKEKLVNPVERNDDEVVVSVAANG
jgi:NAD(P)-dependent dehydrogenase (short-subunit alcohol dehydrogenase family)